MHIDTAHKAFELAIGGSNAREWTNRTIHAASSFQGPHGERPRAPKDLPRHATAAVLCLAQAALCGSMFPACVGGARRSVLLRAARPGETIPANNATERPVVDGMRPRNVGFAIDPPREGEGFEPSVPHESNNVRKISTFDLSDIQTGATPPVLNWRARLVCSRCRSRQVDAVVSGTEHR
jgi:hypothetical protein